MRFCCETVSDNLKLIGRTAFLNELKGDSAPRLSVRNPDHLLLPANIPPSEDPPISPRGEKSKRKWVKKWIPTRKKVVGSPRILGLGSSLCSRADPRLRVGGALRCLAEKAELRLSLWSDAACA